MTKIQFSTYNASKYLLASVTKVTTVPNRLPPSEEELDATQTAILDAAIVCAMKYGFGGITTRRIAEEAGVNEVTIFRRFGSKAEVIKAAFRREASTVQAEAVHYSGILETDLRRIVEVLWQAAGRRQATLPLLLAELPRNPELREAAQQSLAVIGQITQILQQYQQDGLLKAEPPMLTFAALIGPIMFMTLIRQSMPGMQEKFQPEDYVRLFLEGRGIPRA